MRSFAEQNSVSKPSACVRFRTHTHACGVVLHFSVPIGYTKNTKRDGRAISFCVFGLPERIRTVDLQSRSLTRYPAVPRVDINVD